MSVSRQEIINMLVLSPKRFLHTLGTEKAALELARIHYPNIDMEKVSQAALLHDLTKEYTVSEHVETACKFGVTFTEEELMSPKLLHSKTASYICRYDLKLSDEVCDAIYYHTTGRMEMTPLQKILYFADYIEENRTDEECVSLRENYFNFLEEYDPESAFNKALVLSFDRTISNLMKKGHLIDKNTVDARNYYLKKTL